MLKALVKTAAKKVLATPPVINVIRRRNIGPEAAAILCYHTVGRDDGNIDAWTVLKRSDFLAQLREIRSSFDIVTLDDLLDGPGTKTGKPRAVLTFDDGDIGLFRHLLPIVQAEQVPVTIYVATGQVEAGRPYWFDRVMNALQLDDELTLDLSSSGLGIWQLPSRRGASRWAAVSDLLEGMKALAPDTREELAERICDQASGHVQVAFEPLRPMTIGQIQELAQSSWVTMGAHSHCHNLLDQIPVDEARSSAEKSRNLLQEWTGQPIRHFAYPNGNHNAAIRDAMKDLGFRSAVNLDNRLSKDLAENYALSRIAVGRYDTLDRFRLRLAGL